MSGYSNIWKVDKDLNALIQFNATSSPSYRGIYYNVTNGFIYIAPLSLTVIHVFDLNITFNHIISISPYSPY